MATGDVYENEMRIVDAVDYLRGLVGKDSVAITPASLFSGLVRSVGTIPPGSDLNEYLLGLYKVYPEAGSVINGPSFARFILICFDSGGHIAQFAVDVHPGSYNIQYRASHNSGESWNVWKSISIT